MKRVLSVLFIVLFLGCVLNIPGRLAWAGPNEGLIHAASGGDVGGVEDALRAGADVNAKDASGFTALFMAAWGGHANVIPPLLRAGADVNARDKYGNTPLLQAAAFGQVQTVLFLLKNGADITIRNKSGRTAWDYAGRFIHHVKDSSGAIVDILPDPGLRREIRSIIERYARTQNLTRSVQNDDLSGVQDALSSGVDPNTMYGSSGETPLWDAVNRGYADIVMALLSHGADANMAYQGKTPLYVVAENGHKEIVQALLDRGANLNHSYNGKTPLDAAKANGHDDIVQLLRSSTGP